MKAKIDKFGNLHIERAGKFKKQYCPYTAVVPEPGAMEMTSCGDWCPLLNIDDDGYYSVSLSLCKKEYFVAKNDFIDERQK